MIKCPKCGADSEIDYGLHEEPYLICTNHDCDWYEESFEDEKEEK